jgi:UbiD family decarboxylase
MHYSILAGKNAEHNTLGSIATYSIRRTLAAALRRALPQIHDLHVYLEPGFGSMAHIAISIGAGAGIEPMALIDAAFKTGFPSPGGELPLSLITKRIVVVNDDVKVHDMADVEWAMWTRLGRAQKFRVMPDVRSWELERCAKEGVGSLRLAVDATIDAEDFDKLRRTVIPGAEHIRLADYLDSHNAPQESP